MIVQVPAMWETYAPYGTWAEFPLGGPYECEQLTGICRLQIEQDSDPAAKLMTAKTTH